MGQLYSQSAALQQAIMKSERLRIRIVFAAIGAAFLVRTLRTAIHFNREGFRVWVGTSLLIALFVAYEFLRLRAVNRTILGGPALPRATWILNIVVESSLLAFGLVLLSAGPVEQVYKPLANPAVLVYFIFILLSTLRLDPVTCRIWGILAAVTYLVAAAYLGWRPMVFAPLSLESPERAVFSYAITMIVAGFVAGAVAAEVRKQVEAALREAEAKRQIERLEHDLDVARSIQQSLLPAVPPSLEGFEIAGWNQPADQTGGDYYDWQVLPDGKLIVALADVTGHGIGPALLAAVCRAYARASFTFGRELLTAMEHVNSALSKDLQEGRFVTFVAALCTAGSSRVELLSAGHGPLFFYWLRDDRFESMSAQGLPLGIAPDLISEPPRVMDLLPGDMLVFTTDGFFEWANANGEEFGAKRLEDTIRANKEKSPSEIIATLYQAVIDFAGGTAQKDDLTAVVIKKT